MRHVLLGLVLAAAGLALRGNTSILVVLGFGLVGWGVAQQAAFQSSPSTGEGAAKNAKFSDGV